MSYSEDLIVVDDVDHADESAAETNNPVTPSSHSARATRRRLSAVHAASAIAMGISSDRTTRSSSTRQRGAQPTKLKLKLSDKNGSQISGMSFLGAYDRELDSSEDDLTFEEQFILRMPPGEDCDRLRKAVAARDVGSDVWFKFRGMLSILEDDYGYEHHLQTPDEPSST
jgi:transcription initiation factor TFIID subunit 7